VFFLVKGKTNQIEDDPYSSSGSEMAQLEDVLRKNGKNICFRLIKYKNLNLMNLNFFSIKPIK